MDYVRDHPEGQIPTRLPIFGRFEEQGRHIADDDRALAQQVFHELYLERIIISGSGPNSMSHLMDWPFYRVTEYGKKVLETAEYEPHDPDGYLANLRGELPNLDDVILRYLDESLTSFRHGLLLASAVTLGCAAEKAMLLFVEAFGNAIAGREMGWKDRS